MFGVECLRLCVAVVCCACVCDCVFVRCGGDQRLTLLENQRTECTAPSALGNNIFAVGVPPGETCHGNIGEALS